MLNIRTALREAIRVMDASKDTGNRERYSLAREFFRANYNKRHLPLAVSYDQGKLTYHNTSPQRRIA